MRTTRAMGAVLLSILIGMACMPAAAQVYRWTDRQGNVHYGERPDVVTDDVVGLTRVPIVPARSPLARLTIERDGEHYQAWAENRLPGPVEVMLHLRSARNLRTVPALPARATVPAYGRVLVAYLESAGGTGGPEFDLGLEAVPGRPDATVHDVQYRYPLRLASVQVEQGYGGHWSHTDPADYHAVDFAAAEGTPVLAARDGMVMQAEDGYRDTGSNRDTDAGRANYVRIVHDDGSMAVYAHLLAEGVNVRPGQRVRAGEVIAYSGNTGFSSGPHLHFVVQANRGMRLRSVPFRMFTPRGILKLDGPPASPPATLTEPDRPAPDADL